MTERKPRDMGFESWVDKQIREAMDRGEFDNLPGAGKPIPGHGRPDDELWWVKDYLRREGLGTDALLPTPLRLRKEVERLPETVARLHTEPAVREVAEKLNRRIMAWLLAPVGPQVHVEPVDVDGVVQRWRADREAASERPPRSGAQPAGGQPAGGQPAGGQPAGGQPAGGQPAGGQPAGGATARRLRWWRG